MKPALLVIDMQNAFSDGPNEPFFKSASNVINQALEVFRSKKLPVVWIQQKNESRELVPGKPGFEVFSKLKMDPVEPNVHKQYSNSFRDTDLVDILEKAGVDTVFISGFRAQNCINETYCGALERGYTAAVIKGAIASDDEKVIRLVESTCDSISLRLLRKMLS